MPKAQIVSDKIGKPSGHFAQATVVEARGKLVIVFGTLAKGPDGIGRGGPPSGHSGEGKARHAATSRPTFSPLLRMYRAPSRPFGWGPAQIR